MNINSISTGAILGKTRHMLIKFTRFLRSLFSERAIIPWMLVIAVFPMLSISFFAYDISEKILRQSIYTALTTSIQKKIEVVDTYITERKLDLLQISELPTLAELIQRAEKNGRLEWVDPASAETLTTYLAYLSSKIGATNFYLISPQAKVVYTLHKDALLNLTLSGDQPTHLELYRVFDGARVLQMPYVFSHYTKTPGASSDLYLSYPVLMNGRMKAVLVMRLPPREIEMVIQRYLSYSKSEETLLAAWVDHEPVIVMDTHTLMDKKDAPVDLLTVPRSKQLMQLLDRAIRGESGTPVELEENGKLKLAVYRYVPQLNMGMLIQYDKKEVFEQIRWLAFHIVLTLGIGSLLIIAIVLWISHALREAHLRSERLLENILPKFVIEELKEKKQFVARNVVGVSIVFIDIVNFTPFASSQPPEKVVHILDELFSVFDQICDKYQLEKIKTIGDAYMAVAGLISAQSDHAQRAVDMGIELILAVQHYNLDCHTEFAVRVGIDSGSITAGIIGKRKFSYDLWGNAVNRASRMESTGVANKIQITQDTYDALSDKTRYRITPRKEVLVKGLGKMNTYLVADKSASDGDASFNPLGIVAKYFSKK